MRILIFSDLHANYTALAALQSAEKKPDAIFFLGDAVGYGPDIAECVGWVKNNASCAVQGDHDLAAAIGADCASPADWRDLANATRDVNLNVLSKSYRDYLRMLPPTQEITLGGVRFLLMHTLPGAGDSIVGSDSSIRQSSADVVLFGHTHIPSIRRVNEQWFVNPGSLGQPRHGAPSATYAIWEDGALKIQHIDYDPRSAIERLALLPLDPDYVSRLQHTLAYGI
jgi:putative phosphoesterase